MALAKKLNISIDDMKEMSFVSLMNILLSATEEVDNTRTATESDIRKMFG